MDERFIEFLKAKGTTLEKEREKELDEFMKRLEERKQEYNASGRGIDFNKEQTDEEVDERMHGLENWIRDKYRNAPEDFIQRELGALRDMNARPPDREPSSHGDDRRKYEEIRKESQKKRTDELPESRTMVSQWFDEDYLKPRTQLDFAQYTSTFGVDIGEEIVCQKELHLIVNDMKVKLVDEKKILEGTLNPQYGKGDWTMPHIVPHIERVCSNGEDMLKVKHIRGDCETSDGKVRVTENELSNSKPTEEQWNNESQNGSLITGPTHISTTESNNSACIAELFNRDCPIARSDDKSTPSSTNSCSGKLDDCGIEIDATNECSECTVPMISAAMLGTPNEVRWSPPRRSMESLGQSLPDVK